MSILAQKDSLKNKHQLFLSFTVGLPIYNNFVYRNESRHLTVDGKSKRKPSFNFGLEHNVNHFTFNLLINYFQNELIGEPFGTFGNYIYSANSNQMNF